MVFLQLELCNWFDSLFDLEDLKAFKGCLEDRQNNVIYYNDHLILLQIHPKLKILILVNLQSNANLYTLILLTS